MANTTIGWTIGPACTGDNHFAVTVTGLPTGNLTFAATKPDLQAALSKEDWETFAMLLTRVCVSLIPGKKADDVKKGLDPKKVTLD